MNRTFVCDKCGFEIRRDKNPKKCSYCGKGAMHEKPSAQDVLDETLEDYEEIEQQRQKRQ